MIQLIDLQRFARARVSGVLTQDAHITMHGAPPRAMLHLHFAPSAGLPYLAHVDLGTDATDHIGAEADLVYLRSGALVSVGCDALQLQADHGHAVLRLLGAYGVVIPTGEHGQPLRHHVPHAPAPRPVIQGGAGVR